jgi:hypothetical protein
LVFLFFGVFANQNFETHVRASVTRSTAKTQLFPPNYRRDIVNNAKIEDTAFLVSKLYTNLEWIECHRHTSYSGE